MKRLVRNGLFAVRWTLSIVRAAVLAGPLFGMLAGWIAPEGVGAQPSAVIPRLKGIGTGEAPGYGSDVEVAGKFAYVSWSWGNDTNNPGGLEIYDVTNPSAPVRVGGYKGDAWANALEVAGRYAYLAEGTARTLTNDPGALEIIDVNEPANPVRVGRIETLGRANAVRVAGNMAYVAEGPHWTGSNLTGALEVFDASRPTNPVRKAIFDTAGAATSVDVSANYAYLADGVTDLQVLDVSDPGNPRRVGIYLSDVAHNGCGFEPGGPGTLVQVVNGLAYSAGDNGLHILDISDPEHPTSIGDNFCFPVSALHVADQHAYLAVWHSVENTFYLSVEDVSTPANLAPVGMKRNFGGTQMQVKGDLMYVAAIPLEVYEISDRPAITWISMEINSLVVAWEYAPGFILQRGAAVADLWSDVAGSGDVNGLWGMTLPRSSGNEFFRLVRP